MMDTDEAQITKMSHRIFVDCERLEKERSLQIQKLILSYAKALEK